MHHLLVPCFAAAGVLAAGSASPARAQDDAMAACKAVGAAYDAAANSGNPAMVAAQFTADGVLTAPEGIFQGTRAIAAYEAAVIKPGVGLGATITAARQIGGANVILCSGVYTLTFAPGSPMKQGTGTYTKVAARSDSEWRLEQLTFSYTPPPAQPQSQRQSQNLVR